MKKTIITLALVATGTSALAWGDREQGILAGAAATLLLQHIHNAHRQPPVVVQQPPVIVQQPQVMQAPPVVAGNGGVVTDRPLTCISRPVLFDQFTGAPIKYETVCR